VTPGESILDSEETELVDAVKLSVAEKELKEVNVPLYSFRLLLVLIVGDRAKRVLLSKSGLVDQIPL
jgi:hypothetical protein